MTFHMQKCFSAKLQYRDYQILLVVVVVIIVIIIIIIIIIISSSSSSSSRYWKIHRVTLQFLWLLGFGQSLCSRLNILIL